MTIVRHHEGRVLLTLALLAALVFGGRSIADETAVSLQGDMPRHLMNGVFVRDYLATPSAWSPSATIPFASRYFAQYPALSIGHHPPLLPLVLVPFYEVFGLSVFAGRLAILVCFVAATALTFAVARQRFDTFSAGWASLLFATNPFIVSFGQIVMAEMLMIVAVLGAIYWLNRFRDLGHRKDFILFMLAAIASVVARQLAVVAFPFYAAMFLFGGGKDRLFRRDVIVWTSAGIVAVTALGLLTLSLSPFNVGIVKYVLRTSAGAAHIRQTVGAMVEMQLTPALWVALACGLIAEMVMRERRIIQFVVWILSITCGVVLLTGPYDAARYAVLAVPAYCICGAAVSRRLGPIWRGAFRLMLCGVVAVQALEARTVVPAGANGYEEAAQYVLANQKSGVVLYSASVDTGYFVFFTRKHDPKRQTVVVRADKVFTTSLMGNVDFARRINRPEEVTALLRRLGVRFVVLEDRPSGSEALDWLRAETQKPSFAERRRIPFETTDRRLKQASLVIYEYLEATPVDHSAELDLDLPLVGRQIRVRIADLIDRP